MQLVILSRAPLSYYAGIPKFCKTLSSSLSDSHIVLNYSLTKSNCNNNSSLETTYFPEFGIIKEYTYRSQFVYKTLAFSFGYFRALLNLAFGGNVLFHYQHPDPFTAVCLVLCKLLNLRGVKIVVTWHAEIYKTFFLFSPFLVFLDLVLFSLSDRIVFPTYSHLKSSLLRFLAFDRRKVSFIPFGLYPSGFALQHRRELSISKSSSSVLSFLSIGRLVPYKGYETAIRAFSILKKRFPGFRYDIIGSGPLSASIRQLIDRHNLSSNVFIHTHVDDNAKLTFLRDSDCFLLPSSTQAEAFGLVQLEAFAHSLPILNTFLNNGVNEVAPSTCSITVPPNSPSLMANQLLRLCSNPLYLDELSSLSCQRSDSFGIEIMCNAYSLLFKSLEFK